MSAGLTRGLIVSAAGLVALSLVFITAEHASAKSPGATYCFGGWCHRVSTLEEMHGMVGRRGYLKASYYDDCSKDRFNPCGLTSSGEVFRPDQPDNAASPIFPDGTVVLAYHPETKRAAVLRVNSAGPYRGDRTLDVSRATAEKLDFVKKGVAELLVTVLKSPDPHEAKYRKERRYDPVPGYMGRFSSFDEAQDAALERLDLSVSHQLASLEDENGAAVPSLNRPVRSEPRVDVEDEPFAATLSSASPDEALLGAAPEILGSTAHAAQLAAMTHYVGTDLVTARSADTIALAPPSGVVASSSKMSSIGETRRGKWPLFASEHWSSSSEFWRRWHSFVEAALKAAIPRRATGENMGWIAWAEEIVQEARLKARAGVRDSGSFKSFTAELTFKARAAALEGHSAARF